MKYPKAGQEYLKNRPGGICSICKQEDADMYFFIEFSIFRGEDKRYLVHKKCIKGIRRDIIVNTILRKDKK